MNDSRRTEDRSTPQKITTFLTFAGRNYGKAEEAIRFYVSLFPDSRVEYLERHGGADSQPANELRRGAFTLAGQRFLATEDAGGDRFRFTPGFSLYVECRTPEECTNLYEALSNGGKVHLPLGPYPSSRLFAWLDDRFGVSWQLELPKLPSH